MPQSNLISGKVVSAPPQSQGFDSNTIITPEKAAAFVQSGFSFCVRYVGRTEMSSSDLTTQEANDILDAGLALMVVQHVSAWGWSPSPTLGTEYGTNAGKFANQIGIPPGVNLWCDLEGVAAGTSAQTVIAYCNNWYEAVVNAGYVPGIYIGAACILNSSQLYNSLKFSHYWKSGSTVPDVMTRGYQIIQYDLDSSLNGIEIDKDVTQNDHLGGQAQWLIRSGDLA